MSNQANVPQQLQEIVGRGFPEPQFLDALDSGTYGYVDQHDTILQCVQPPAPASRPGDTERVGIGYCFDGSFLPVRHGAGYTLYNLMRTVGQAADMHPTLINCYRGWDDPQAYHNQNFGSVFVHPDDYYNQTGVVEAAFGDLDITNAQFYSPEGLLNLGPRLRRIGARVIFEVQNTDHVLLERLGASAVDVSKARDLEKQALEITDHTFCRSEIDRYHAIELGADPSTVSVYRGGIHVGDFTFQPRTGAQKSLVFLGHMYYQPNENALDYIADEVLPNLPEDFTVTVIGIAPPKVLSKYSDPRIVFKEGVDNLDEELLRHDIALAPLKEGSGTRLKILDYLASGLPVLTTTLGIEGLDSAISDYVIVEDNLNAYASHIRDLTAHPETHVDRSKAGRAFVEKAYDWNACVAPFLDIYRSSR